MVYIPPDQIWIVVAAFIVSFILAVALGANDVANSFATSVGSKVLTLRGACILGTIFEVAGAVLLGARVSDTIRKGIIDVTTYGDTPEVLLVGYLSALTGAGIWLMVATVLKLPVSGTHSIIGSTIGFARVARGPGGITWLQVGLIGASWVISPLLSGIVSVLIFLLIKYLVLNKADKLVAGLRLLPVFYGVTIIVNAFSIFYEGPEQLYLDRIPLWGTFIIAFGAGTIAAVVTGVLFVPWQRKKILVELEQLKTEEVMRQENNRASASNETDSNGNDGQPTITYYTPEVLEMTSKGNSVESDHTKSASNGTASHGDHNNKKNSEDANVESEADSKEVHHAKDDPPEVASLFSKLQILTAIFGSFAHGGNDVSNAIGPLVAVWLITTEGNVLQKAATPIWVLFYGGLGITVGLWALGRRVIETMGSDLTKVTPSSGFTIEIGSALTVLVASNIGIPISTTHCKVGSVVCVGRVRSKDNVDWKLFINIIIAWVVTLPAAGLISAGTFYGLQYLVPPLGPPWNMPTMTAANMTNMTTVLSNITTLATNITT